MNVLANKTLSYRRYRSTRFTSCVLLFFFVLCCASSMQVGIVAEDRKFRILSEQEVKDFLDEAN